MDHCIVYFSSSAELFDEKQLADIIEHSRVNNARLGITGVLLYVRGGIIQVLEGEKDVVEALYQRIERDNRHTNVNRLLSRPIQTRLFGEWSMGYETISDRQFNEIRAIVDLEDSQKRMPQPDEPIVLKTIKVFYDSNRYN